MSLPPRMRALSARKTAVLSALDIGTSKVVCLIARLDPIEAPEALRGRTHRCRVLGIGHQRSAGLKGGVIVDLEAAEGAIRRAVDAADAWPAFRSRASSSILPAAGSVRSIIRLRSASVTAPSRNPTCIACSKPAPRARWHRAMRCFIPCRRASHLGYAQCPRSEGDDERRARRRYACRQR